MVCGLLSIYYSIWFWRNSESTTRRILAYFALSFCCSISLALIYKFIFNVLQIPHSNVSELLASLYNIPYMGTMAFQLLAWGSILYLNNAESDSRRLFLYTPVIIISLACLSLFFFIFDTFNTQHWIEGSFLHVSYDFVEALLQIASFATALLCLAVTRSKGLFYIALGYLIIIAVDITMNFGIFAQSYGTRSFVEKFWILGVWLRVYGLVHFKKENAFKLSPKEWICRLDEPRAQGILWTPALLITGVYMMFALIYFVPTAATMEPQLLQTLVSIFIFFLIIIVTLSNLFGKKLYSPIEGMEGIVSAFLPKKTSEESPMTNKLNPISRFRNLETFMARAFKSLETELAKERKLSEITSVIAHDVRKPFTQLKSMLEVFPQLKEDEIDKYSGELDSTIRKVEAMLSDIMEYSREAEYVVTPGNVLAVLDLSIKDVSHYNPGKHVKFYYDLEPLNLINLDEQRLSRAFDNIIGNAFEAMPDENAFMWFVSENHEEKARIIIGNSGSYIPKDQVDKIFENKFTSGKKSGTGLGLSITKKIIEGHKGIVVARNVEGAPDFVPENSKDTQGVEFVVVLPTTEQSENTPLKDPLLRNSQEINARHREINKKSQLANSTDALTSKTSILIVNDDLLSLRLFSAMAKSSAKNDTLFFTAEDYRSAQKIIDKERPSIVITDHNLETRETGIDVCRYAKEKNQKTVSVLYSGLTQNELENLKDENKDWVDEAHSTSIPLNDVLDRLISFKF